MAHPTGNEKSIATLKDTLLLNTPPSHLYLGGAGLTCDFAALATNVHTVVNAAAATSSAPKEVWRGGACRLAALARACRCICLAMSDMRMSPVGVLWCMP